MASAYSWARLARRWALVFGGLRSTHSTAARRAMAKSKLLLLTWLVFTSQFSYLQLDQELCRSAGRQIGDRGGCQGGDHEAAHQLSEPAAGQLSRLDSRLEGWIVCTCLSFFASPLSQKKGWVTAKGDPVKNKEELILLDEKLTAHKELEVK